MTPANAVLAKNMGASLAIAIALLAHAGLTLPGRIDRLLDLRDGGRDATAAVVGTDCADHGRVRYEFVVNAVSFAGASNRCDRPCGLVKTGDPLVVRYVASNPAVNVCGSVLDRLDDVQSEATWTLLVCVVLVGAGAIKSAFELKALRASAA